MHCLVTGASGHLGAHLTKRLLHEGWQVTVLIRPESKLWRLTEVRDQVTVIRANLADISSAAPAIIRAGPEAVFHLAWEGVSSGFKNDPVHLADNVTGSIELFEIVRNAGCKLWVGVGSQAEYGPHGGVLTEETPANPVTAYGRAKLSVGLQTKKLCEASGVRYLWLRLLATYGPMDDERHLIPTVIRHLLEGVQPQLTAGEQLWDYLYVEDAAEALYRAAVSKNADGVFNLGSGESHRVRSIAERIRDLIDPSLPLVFGQVPYSPDQIMRLETSIDRLRQTTGWTPRIELEEGLKRTVEWYKTRYLNRKQ